MDKDKIMDLLDEKLINIPINGSKATKSLKNILSKIKENENKSEFISLSEKLMELEKQFKEAEYAPELIDEIELREDANCIRDFIDNLIEERSCWIE